MTGSGKTGVLLLLNVVITDGPEDEEVVIGALRGSGATNLGFAALIAGLGESDAGGSDGVGTAAAVVEVVTMPSKGIPCSM